MNFLNNIYLGKITSCHTQAIFNAYFQNSSFKDYILFEIATTNPFGVQYIPNDPNRVLDSYLDFDLGLDRAFELLGIEYRISFNKDIDYSLNLLKQWLKKGRVVVGPLNMEKLPYLYYPQLYKALDHYLVVQKYEESTISLLDSEGIAYIEIDEDRFAQAWKADKIIEGRGQYMMRQIFKKEKIEISQDKLQKLYLYIVENLDKAQQQSAYKKIIEIKDNYILNSLTYAIPNRLQKLFIQKKFFEKNENIIFLLNQQIVLFSDILSNIFEKKEIDFNKFSEINKIENALLIEIKKLIK